MPLSLMHRQYIPSARTVIFFLLLLIATGVARAATFGVTTPGQQTLTNRFLPYAGSGTQLIGNSPAWRDSAGVLGINNYLEGLETLTPAAAVNLNFSTWRTKRITLNQNTVFTAINIPSASTNVQTMLLEVIGDGAFTVSFANVTWQTPEITTPEAGVVTLYALRGDNGAVKGYTQAVTATGIGPLTVGYVPVANATNNLTDSILLQSADTIAVQHGGTNSIELTGGASAGLFLHADTGQPSSISSDDSILFNVAQGVTTDSFLLGTSLFRPSTVSQALLGDSTHPWIGVYADAHYWGGAVTSYDSGAGVNPEGVITAGPGSIWRNTTTGDIWKKSSGLGDTGWVQLVAGSALWSSSSGNLTPSPAVDVVSIQSQSADNATNVAAIIDTTIPWTLGGTLLSVKTAGGNPVLAVAMNFLTNFWGDWGSLVALGYSATPMDFATLTVNTNTQIYNIGDTSGAGQDLHETSEIFNYGDISGINQRAVSSSELFNYGFSAGGESKYTNSNNHFLFGALTGIQSTNTAVDNLYAFGSQAASYQSLSNVQDAYFFGSHAGEGMIASGINHVFALGSDSVVTNSNDYVFGNALYNYFFPGASIDFAGGSASSKFHVNSSGDVTANSYTAATTNMVGGLAGKVTGAGTSVIGQVPYYTDTSGKAVSPSGGLILDASTNASVVGILYPHAVFVTNTITAALGSVSAPSITFTNDSDTGIYSAGANTISIGTAANEIARFSTGNANLALRSALGIGATAAAPDAYLVRDAANVFRLGLTGATPSDQTLKSAEGFGTDKNGAGFLLLAGAGTGTGRGGDLIVKTALTGATTGSTANSQSTRFQAVSKAVDLTESTATAFQKFTLATNNYAGGSITATVRASDAAFAMQSLTSTLKFDAVNVGGTNVVTITQVDDTLAQIPTGGTLTCTYDAINEGSNVFSIRANATSSLTQTALRVKWVITALNSSDAIIVTPQP